MSSQIFLQLQTPLHTNLPFEFPKEQPLPKPGINVIFVEIFVPVALEHLAEMVQF